MSRIAKGASVHLNTQTAALAKMGEMQGFGDTPAELLQMGSMPTPRGARDPGRDFVGYIQNIGANEADMQMLGFRHSAGASPGSAAANAKQPPPPGMGGMSPGMPGFPASPQQSVPTVANYQGSSEPAALAKF